MATSRPRSIFGHIPKGYLNIRQNAASCRRTHAFGFVARNGAFFIEQGQALRQNRLCLILFGLLFQKVSRRAAIERKTAKSPPTITTKTAWVRRQDAAFWQIN